jgi:F-type H+-transporting ATPase subunit delta
VEKTTLARPYAKAAYQYASQENKMLDWLSFLEQTAAVIQNEAFKALLNNPRFKKARFIEFLLGLIKHKLSDEQKNFLTILLSNQKISILPEIVKLFEEHRREAEKKTTVKVISAFTLPEKLQENLSKALKIRLQNDIVLDIMIDNSLIGGAIIRYGDLVIDGSIKTRLQQLKLALQS